MRKLCVAWAVVLLVGCGAAEDQVQKKSQELNLNDVCMLYFEDKDVPEALAKAVIEGAGATLSHYLDGTGIALINGCSKLFGASTNPAIAGIESLVAHELSKVAAVQEQAPAAFPGDAYYYMYQWDIRRVKADKAWKKTSGSHNTVVAVIDTGVAFNHPDLAPNKVSDSCFNMESLIDGVPCSPYPTLHWHGTHVAGTVAAAFGNGLAVGVGPGLGIANYNVFEIIDGKYLAAYDYSIWAALWDAANKGYDAANLSLGSYLNKPMAWYSPAFAVMWNRVATYCKQKGLTVVAAAGNDGAFLNGPAGHMPSDLSSIISVGATGIGPAPEYPQPGFYDTLAFYSNYGAEVTLGAPGGDCGPVGCGAPGYKYHLVFSTYVLANPACAATQSCPTTYAWAGGTSMATPHVAGAVGLMRDANPKLPPNQISSILKKTAEPLGSQLVFGHGMLDVAAALGVK